MVYTYCGHTCPRILAELKRIEAGVPADVRDGVAFTLISLDPTRDTPARLKEFAHGARLDPARWTLLATDEDGVRETAALLGIRYREEAGGAYSHANTYLVLDGAGRILHRQTALGAGGPEASLAAIRAAGGAVAADRRYAPDRSP
jgi:protein SCO1/2